MSERVTCANCGYLNEPSDEFCGDCGTYLAWSGAAGTDPASAATPPPPPVPTPPAPVSAAPPPPIKAAAKTPAGPVAPPPPVYVAPVYAAPANQPPPGPPPAQQPPQQPSPPTYGVMPPPQAPGVPCRNCGLMNPPGRSFCQRCGQKLDPAVGTMAGSPRPAAGPPTAAGAAASGGGSGGKRLAIAGVAAIFIAAVAGIALVLSGALGGNKAVSPTPITALASSTPEPTLEVTLPPDVTTPPDATPKPTRRPTPEPTEVPVATDEPTEAATPEPTVEPVPTPKKTPKPTTVPTPSPPTPSQAPPPGTYVCDTDSSIPDPLGAGWNIRRIDWVNKGKYDRLIVTLDQKGTGGDGTQAIVHVMPPDEVPTTLKVSAPQAGDVAIALGLFQDVKLTWSLDRALTLPALKWITMEKDNNGFPWIVLGADGVACYSLQIPDWSSADPQPATTVLVTIDVKH
jgi:hypothetical protein